MMCVKKANKTKTTYTKLTGGGAGRAHSEDVGGRRFGGVPGEEERGVGVVAAYAQGVPRERPDLPGLAAGGPLLPGA